MQISYNMMTTVRNNPGIKYFILEFILLLLYNSIIINLQKIRRLPTKSQ